ncbi:MAG: DUF1700 domain-containing protein [Saccharofermentans sp.]|nr:DUF1700 domain-containing protein [Saccharofermentans sp.]
MNKKEYLDSLEKELEGMSYKEAKEILGDISEHFDAGIASGKSEEAIAEGLGDVSDMAKEFKKGLTLPVVIKNKQKFEDAKKSGPDTFGVIFVVLMAIFVAIPLWIIVFSTLVLIAAAFLALLGVIATLVAGLFLGWFPGFAVSIVLTVITLVLFDIFVFIVMFLGFKYLFKLTSMYVDWNKKIWYQGLE